MDFFLTSVKKKAMYPHGLAVYNNLPPPVKWEKKLCKESLQKQYVLIFSLQDTDQVQ